MKRDASYETTHIHTHTHINKDVIWADLDSPNRLLPKWDILTAISFSVCDKLFVFAYFEFSLPAEPSKREKWLCSFFIGLGMCAGKSKKNYNEIHLCFSSFFFSRFSILHVILDWTFHISISKASYAPPGLKKLYSWSEIIKVLFILLKLETSNTQQLENKS